MKFSDDDDDDKNNSDDTKASHNTQPPAVKSQVIMTERQIMDAFRQCRHFFRLLLVVTLSAHVEQK